MKFRTELILKRSDITLDPRHQVAMLGSCFAENIAGRMRRCLWNASNPLGTLYNPLSIERVVRLLLFDDNMQGTFIRSQFKTGRLYYSWLFDSRTSSEYKDDCLRHLCDMNADLLAAITDSSVLFVTFGTSWCYFLAEDPDYVVANCHKQPATMFVRRRLSVDEIAETWIRLASDLRVRFPELRIVFTVSPVRHLKDGFSGNTVSKAVLQVAIDEICSQLAFCSYFPAFELVNDDLRDYRFYASDLVHPSDEAVEYIWDGFKTVYLDDNAIQILKEGENLMKAWNHRPLLSSFSRISEQTGLDEKLRRQKIECAHADFIMRNPGMLPLHV